ncbi:MAG: UDP-N-acetylmuramoyl-L-alanyl-D-glutamate--2,6-diaminopimelate ligase [Acidobacteria bacterium]|nr:UDP-N-acetylmuramoyl-L-alanyl-D-glutamate--2,6-diaminopimelate ligase [Acidobacteriota bacterium]
MTLRELMDEAAIVAVSSSEILDVAVAGLTYDSRTAGPGYAFFAFAGAKADGRRFAAGACAQGAIAVIYEELPSPAPEHPYVAVRHLRRALAHAARRFYGAPDEAVAITGFTGTNGKSTGSLLVDGILKHSGRRTSLINTIGYHICGEPRAAANTTPESLDIYRMLAETRERRGGYLTMEISSHALELGRVAELRVAVAVFTNLTRDHLDFHGTMENYFHAKARLFGGEFKPGAAVLNADDEWSGRIPVAAGTRTVTYGIRNPAELRAVHIETGFFGLRFEIEGKTRIESKLIGDINVYNILAAAGASHALGLTWAEISEGVAAFAGVPGRFERVDAGQNFLVVVDYAHTDAALTNVIGVARNLVRGKGRVITLFGCGGDRDRAKRPLMGAAAAEASDFVVLTSDNPRSEDPLAIINDALVGVRRHDTPLLVEPDRERAIFAAIGEAKPGDIVLLAGKGHENYQVLNGRTIDFDDKEVALRALRLCV